MAEWRPRLSIRVRLLIIALLPMLIVMPLMIGATMQRWIWRTDGILAARVASDLTVAQQYLAHLIEQTGRDIVALGQSVAFQDAMAGDPSAFLQRERRRLGLDFLLLSSAATQGAGSGIEVLDPTALATLAPDLPARARIALPDGGDEARGMVIRATAPVQLASGTPGFLSGGMLLSGNEDFIDRINDLVYPPADPRLVESLGGTFDHGITTLFLDDIRIATTLRPGGGERAVGTRASPEVSDRVLGRGESWHDVAHVVNDWYISAYEALVDRQGKRVGMLYTGIPRAPYTAARQLTWAIIGAAFLGATLLTVPLFLAWARGIFRPLEAMGHTLSRVEVGDLSARSFATDGAPGGRVDEIGTDEIGRLARHLDRLLGLLEDRDRDLRSLNADLNARVEARTADLVAANRALETAMRQLVLSEKLATIGQVTAGVAHEINNPLAVIQGNLEVLRMVLSDRTGEVATELALIDGQIRRISTLVNQLLQFTRPEEFAGAALGSDPAEALAGIRPVVRHLLSDGRVALAVEAWATRRVAMNGLELQQILVNLVVNAIQSMPGTGTVDVVGEDAPGTGGRAGVRLTVRDDGPGMDGETLSHVFEPFFTTRGIEGTGLGLSICLNLANRCGGTLTAESRLGEGASFFLWLPAQELA